jgi:hypothetical protein
MHLQGSDGKGRAFFGDLPGIRFALADRNTVLVLFFLQQVVFGILPAPAFLLLSGVLAALLGIPSPGSAPLRGRRLAFGCAVAAALLVVLVEGERGDLGVEIGAFGRAAETLWSIQVELRLTKVGAV